MRNITAFRSASVLLFIFCLMHTGGGMLAQKSLGPASDVVFDSMKSVHFSFNGADSTWYGFWFGFGLTASIFLLLSAIVAWEFERIPNELWPSLQVIAWAFVLGHVANTVLAWKYFFAGPGVFGILISVLLAVGTARKSRRAAAERRLASS
jgi:hypothetical protein